MYTAVVLDELSKSNLIGKLEGLIPDGWEIVCHHMTINLGRATDGPAVEFLGKPASLIATKVAQDDKVIAVAVQTDVPSKNNIKHITVAVNRLGGGKPKDSNSLQNWIAITPINLNGVVAELE